MSDGPKARRPTNVAVAVCVALLLSVPWFLPSLHGEFLTWDDDRNLLTNPHYRGLGWAQIRWMFSSFHLGHYQPLTWLTFGLDHVLWGMRPFGYRAANLVLHGLNVTLVLSLVRIVLRQARPDAPLAHVAWAAVAGAVLFGVHPLRVESVAWITERRQLLSTALLLAALHLHLRSWDSGRRRDRWLAVSLHALATLAAAWAVVLPPVLVVLDWYLGRWAGPFARRPILGGRRYWRQMAPFVVLAVLGVAVNVAASQAATAGRALADHSLVQRMAQACFGLVYYLGKMAVPVDLAPLYQLEPRLDPTSARYVGAAVGVVAMTAAAYAFRRRLRGVWAAWLAYGIVLSPALGLFQVGAHVVADRYSYLAAMPWSIVAATGCLALFSRVHRRRANWRIALPSAVVSCVLGPPTLGYSSVWRDSVSLWSRAVAVDERSYIAQTNLAHALEISGRPTEAIEHYRRSLAIRPGDLRTRYKLGLAYARIHRYEAALAEWRPLVARSPRMAELHFSIGLASLRLARFADAVESFRRAVDVQPAYAEAHRALGAALRAMGRREEAERAFDAAGRVARPYRPAY